MVGPKRGKPWSDPLSRHWSKRREAVGNKGTDRGAFLYPLTPVIPTAPQPPRTLGSHRQVSAVGGDTDRACSEPRESLPWEPTHFRIFPLAQGAPCSFREISWMRPRQGPDPSPSPFPEVLPLGPLFTAAWAGSMERGPRSQAFPRAAARMLRGSPRSVSLGAPSSSHGQGTGVVGSTLPPQPTPSNHLAPGLLTGNQVSGPLLKGPPPYVVRRALQT